MTEIKTATIEFDDGRQIELEILDPAPLFNDFQDARIHTHHGTKDGGITMINMQKVRMIQVLDKNNVPF